MISRIFNFKRYVESSTIEKIFDLFANIRNDLGGNDPKHLPQRILLNIHLFDSSLPVPKDVRRVVYKCIDNNQN